MLKKAKNTALNRARDALITASSCRRSRSSEIKGKNPVLFAPRTRTWWIAGYAADKDPETCWACAKDNCEWLTLQLGNRLMPLVPIKRIVVIWGDNRASRYALLGSGDGRDFDTLKGVFFDQPGPKIFDFDEPVELNSLKLEFYSSAAGKSVSIRELQVFGPSQEQMPATPAGVKAEAVSSSEIKLGWTIPENGGPVYLFKIFRSNSPDFTPGDANLVFETDLSGFVDRGLKPGTTYYYKVGSEGFSGDRNLSAPLMPARTAAGAVFYRMPLRGVIEGFYNQPWPHPERIRMLRFMAQNNFNYYIYAPKNDPYHRQLWRESYPEESKDNFRELVQAAAAVGVTFNYGISPGLNINYQNLVELERLKSKLKEMFELGIREFTLCLDDIPGSHKADEKMALDQVKVVNEMKAFLKSLAPDTRLFFVPTVYSFPYSHWLRKNKKFTQYLEALAKIDQEVLIMWTGPDDVFSDTIELESAAEYQKLWSRPLLIWDNYPVNDGGLKDNIFLGPYMGRDLKLGDAVAGIFANPMFLPNASRVPLSTMGEYFSVEDYDPWQAYNDAISALGRGGGAALKDLADCLLNHPRLRSRDTGVLPVKQIIDRFWSAYKSGSHDKEEKDLRELFERYARNSRDLSRLENQRLWFELKSASEKLTLYGKAGLATLDYLAEKDRGKRKALNKEARAFLKQASKIECRVADNRRGKFRFRFSPTQKSQPVFKAFIKKALHF